MEVLIATSILEKRKIGTSCKVVSLDWAILLVHNSNTYIFENSKNPDAHTRRINYSVIQSPKRTVDYTYPQQKG